MQYKTEYKVPYCMKASMGSILAFDPGEHIGLASCRWYSLRYRKVSQDYLYQLTIRTYMYMWPDVQDVKKLSTIIPAANAVVYESFNLYAGKAKVQIGSHFPTVECIGFIKGVAITNGIPYRKYPATKVSTVSNSDLEAWLDTDNLPATTHERSALRVLFTYLRDHAEEDLV